MECFIFLLKYSTRKYKMTSMDERREIFRVYIELCKHALNQSAIRIHKCYIIVNNKNFVQEKDSKVVLCCNIK